MIETLSHFTEIILTKLMWGLLLNILQEMFQMRDNTWQNLPQGTMNHLSKMNKSLSSLTRSIRIKTMISSTTKELEIMNSKCQAVDLVRITHLKNLKSAILSHLIVNLIMWKPKPLTSMMPDKILISQAPTLCLRRELRGHYSNPQENQVKISSVETEKITHMSNL